jgi:SAM-dependent methyltransferase
MNQLQEFDSFKKTYRSDIDNAIAFSGQKHDFYTRVKADYLVALLNDFRNSAGAANRDRVRILDIGCGHGLVHPYLLQATPWIDLSGIDMAATVIDEARAQNPGVDYSSYDGGRLPYPDDHFDAAFAIAVMHHVPPEQWDAFLTEMKRVVRPGGIMAIFEHNPFNPLTRWIVNTCPIDENAVLLSRRLLHNLVTKAGFDSVDGQYILFLPFDGRSFRAFDRMMSWCPLGAQYFVQARVPVRI